MIKLSILLIYVTILNMYALNNRASKHEANIDITDSKQKNPLK